MPFKSWIFPWHLWSLWTLQFAYLSYCCPSNRRREWPLWGIFVHFQHLSWYLAHCGMCVCMLSCFSSVQLCDPWTGDSQSSLSMGFSRGEYWSGLPRTSLGDFPDPGTEPAPPASLALQADSLLLSHKGSPHSWIFKQQVWQRGIKYAGILSLISSLRFNSLWFPHTWFFASHFQHYILREVHPICSM